MLVLSRFATIIACIVSNVLIPDHIPSGVTSTVISYTSALHKLCFEAFARWDAIHFLNIASHGYFNEYQLTFFPFYPSTLYIGSMYKLESLTEQEIMIILAVLINTTAFYVSGRVLSMLLSDLGLECRIINTAVLVYCFNPAGVFFTVAYTESSFACFSWLGLYSFRKNRYFISMCCFLLASSLRSNGCLNIAVVTLTWIGQLLGKHQIFSDKPFQYLLSLLLTSLSIVVPSILFSYYSYILLCGNNNFSITSPIVLVQPDTALEFCQATSSSSIQVAYTYMQSKYWNVGFLKYYQFKQLPNFLLATPISCIALYTIYYANEIFHPTTKVRHNNQYRMCVYCGKDVANNSSNNNNTGGSVLRKELCNEPQHQLIQCMTNLLSQPFFPYIFQLGALLVVGLFWANVQITTRLICSSSPIIYAGFAHIILQKELGTTADNSNRQTLMKQLRYWLAMPSDSSNLSVLVLLYIVLFNVLGVILHCNYFPWT